MSLTVKENKTENNEKFSRVLKMIHEGYVVFANLGICSLEEANDRIRQAEINSGYQTRNFTSSVILSADNSENVSDRDIFVIIDMIMTGQPFVAYTLENYEKI